MMVNRTLMTSMVSIAAFVHCGPDADLPSLQVGGETAESNLFHPLFGHRNYYSESEICDATFSSDDYSKGGYCLVERWDSEVRPCVIGFKDKHYRNPVVRICKGVGSINAHRQWNDKVTSIGIPPGAVVTAYLHPTDTHPRQTSWNFAESQENFKWTRINDAISEISVDFSASHGPPTAGTAHEPLPGMRLCKSVPNRAGYCVSRANKPIPCVVGYRHENYSGPVYMSCHDTDTGETVSSGYSRTWVDQVESLTVPFGTSVRGYEHVSNGQGDGHSALYYASNRTLHSMNNRISAFEIDFPPSYAPDMRDFSTTVLIETHRRKHPLYGFKVKIAGRRIAYIWHNASIDNPVFELWGPNQMLAQAEKNDEIWNEGIRVLDRHRNPLGTMEERLTYNRIFFDRPRTGWGAQYTLKDTFHHTANTIRTRPDNRHFFLVSEGTRDDTVAEYACRKTPRIFRNWELDIAVEDNIDYRLLLLFPIFKNYVDSHH